MAEQPMETREVPTGNGWRPVPDPTVLTSAALVREIAGLRELLETKFDTRIAAIDEATRLRHNEQVSSLAYMREEMHRMPILNEEKIRCLQEVVDATLKTYDEKIHKAEAQFTEMLATQNEKFRGIDKQFEERDVRTRDAAVARDTAVAAALQAQKESAGAQNESLTLSINKAERSTSEQISQQGTLLQNSVGALNDKIGGSGGLAERMTRFEGLGLGTASAEAVARQNIQTTHSGNSLVIGVIFGSLGALIGVTSLIVAIVSRIH